MCSVFSPNAKDIFKRKIVPLKSWDSRERFWQGDSTDRGRSAGYKSNLSGQGG